MKQLSVILNVVLLIAVVWLFIAVYGNKGSGTTNSDTTPSASQDEFDFNIAYLRADSLVLNLQMAEDLHDDFTKEQQKLTQQYSSKRASVEKDMNAFQEKVQRGGFLTEASAIRERDKLAARAEKLQREELEMSSKLQEIQLNNTKTVRDTLISYLEKFNANKKYSYIITGESVLIGKDGCDITQEVLNALNEKYSAENGSANTPK
ncbi:MAG: OmpH family outer membrane protein [Bacteroidales bacterium]